jgi:hypothetical protein
MDLRSSCGEFSEPLNAALAADDSTATGLVNRTAFGMTTRLPSLVLAIVARD